MKDFQERYDELLLPSMEDVVKMSQELTNDIFKEHGINVSCPADIADMLWWLAIIGKPDKIFYHKDKATVKESKLADLLKNKNPSEIKILFPGTYKHGKEVQEAKSIIFKGPELFFFLKRWHDAFKSFERHNPSSAASAKNRVNTGGNPKSFYNERKNEVFAKLYLLLEPQKKDIIQTIYDIAIAFEIPLSKKWKNSELSYKAANKNINSCIETGLI